MFTNIIHSENELDTLRLKYLQFFTMLYLTFNLIGAPLVYKLIEIGPIVGPGGLIVLPLVFLVEDIVAEIFGFKISRFLLWLVLISSIIFSVMTLLIVHAPSPSYWTNQSAYNTVFDPLLRTAPSALVAIFAGRFANIYFLTKWKSLLKGKFFWLRCLLATILGSFIALSIFFLLAFNGKVPTNVIEKLFLCDFLVRVGYTAIGGIPLTFIVEHLKRKLQMDTYDNFSGLNPFLNTQER